MHYTSILTILMFILFSNPLIANENIPSRIISLNSNVSEILTSLELEAAVVASDVTSQTVFNNPRIQNLGYHRALSTEGVLAMQADIVIGSSHMGPESTLSTLQKANLNIIKLDDPHTVEALKNQVEQIGMLLHKTQMAELINQKIDEKTNAIQTLTKNNPQTMIFLLNMGQSGLSMAGKNTTGESLIQLLNGVSSANHNGYKPISNESILAINPDVILIGQRSDQNLTKEELIQQFPILANTHAGERDQIISVDASKMIAGISIGLLDEAEHIAHALTVKSESY